MCILYKYLRTKILHGILSILGSVYIKHFFKTDFANLILPLPSENVIRQFKKDLTIIEKACHEVPEL